MTGIATVYCNKYSIYFILIFKIFIKLSFRYLHSDLDQDMITVICKQDLFCLLISSLITNTLFNNLVYSINKYIIIISNFTFGVKN